MKWDEFGREDESYIERESEEGCTGDGDKPS